MEGGRLIGSRLIEVGLYLITVRTLEPWTLAICLYIFFSDQRMWARPFDKSI